MPAKKTAKTAKPKFTKDKYGKKVYPVYKPVGRTKAQTTALMKQIGMHHAMIEQATRYMRK